MPKETSLTSHMSPTIVIPAGCAVTFLRGCDVSNVISDVWAPGNVIRQVLESIQEMTLVTLVTFLPVTSMCCEGES